MTPPVDRRHVHGRRHGERGNALIMTVFVVALGGLLVAVVARMGTSVVGDARAELAADAAALAAADGLALGEGPSEAARAAVRIAAANGARLTACDCDASPVTISVEVDSASGTVIVARASAEVDSPRVSSRRVADPPVPSPRP